jgi:AraC family transcriptional activator of mar-sox-rob regulon
MNQKMQESVIKSLLDWIEKNLHHPLSVDYVASKAGYSKWHLQRIFKEHTGMTLGDYTRGRRLSESATILKITKRDIYDIALEYGFDSQPHFSRAFKKQFGVTPRAFRKSETLDTKKFFAPIKYKKELSLEADIVTLEPMQLVGKRKEIPSKVGENEYFDFNSRMKIWDDHFINLRDKPTKLIGLVEYISSRSSRQEYAFQYTAATAPSDANNPVNNDELITIEKGKYVKFHYDGAMDGMQDFLYNIYSVYLPKNKMIRRKGEDIEIYKPLMSSVKNHDINCQYFIPIL